MRRTDLHSGGPAGPWGLLQQAKALPKPRALRGCSGGPGITSLHLVANLRILTTPT